jgi:hypothetical protein
VPFPLKCRFLHAVGSGDTLAEQWDDRVGVWVLGLSVATDLALGVPGIEEDANACRRGNILVINPGTPERVSW